MGYVAKEFTQKNKLILSICSFVIPICLWCAISYLPFVWHPQVQITSSGSVPYLQVGSRVDKMCSISKHKMQSIEILHHHKVFWLIQFIYPLPMKSLRLWSLHLPHHLNNLIRRGFIKVYGTVLNWYFQLFISSLIGIPLGILCGFSKRISLLTEPFVEFFRYLPAPAFGACWQF